MMIQPNAEAQARRMARLAGAFYLLATATSVFGHPYAPGRLVVTGADAGRWKERLTRNWGGAKTLPTMLATSGAG